MNTPNSGGLAAEIATRDSISADIQKLEIDLDAKRAALRAAEEKPEGALQAYQGGKSLDEMRAEIRAIEARIQLAKHARAEAERRVYDERNRATAEFWRSQKPEITALRKRSVDLARELLAVFDAYDVFEGAFTKRGLNAPDSTLRDGIVINPPRCDASEFALYLRNFLNR